MKGTLVLVIFTISGLRFNIDTKDFEKKYFKKSKSRTKNAKCDLRNVLKIIMTKFQILSELSKEQEAKLHNLQGY